MEISFARCEQVLATLPIGYYTGRRIKAELKCKPEVPASCYSPMDDAIFVCYDQLKQAFDKMPDDADEEEAIRSMLYHEVSHAILTSAELMHYASDDTDRAIVNIFEDERIESILRNYYHNVNFKKQVYNINGGVLNPTNAMSAFYNTVRFGVAPKKLLDMVDEIIQRYKELTPMNERYDWYNYGWYIKNLWEEVKKAFKDDPTQFQPQSGATGSGDGQYSEIKEGKGQKGEGKDGQGEGENQQGKGQQDGEGETQDGEGEGENIGQPTDVIGDTEHNIQNTRERIGQLVGQALDIKSRLRQGDREKLDEFQKTVEMIIGNFNKKNSGGSGINAYSGVFNPRAVARNDYRYFERSMSVQGNNKFGTCHLNLFIDCSGSFCGSQDLVNGMLAVLTAIERKNRNFSMDVVFCGDGVHKCETVADRQIKCGGGNNLPDNMKEVFVKLQKPNTCNYNIVLFDGDAFSDDYDRGRATRGQRIFKTFDYKQTTLITDSDNKRYMGTGFTTAKVVITDRYTQELINHVTKALTVAFG